MEPQTRLLRPMLAAGATMAGGAAALAAGWQLARPALAHLQQLGSGTPVTVALPAFAALALVGCLAWLTMVTVAAVVEQLTGTSARLLAAVTPTAVRRLAALACGAAVTGGSLTTAASAGVAASDAAPPEHAARPAAVTGPVDGRAGSPVTRLVTGLPLPDRTQGPAAAAPATRPDPAPIVYRVVPGDSLWRIAESLLPDHAGPAVVDVTWREIYRLNRERIGPDPDLLTPGLRLAMPAPPRAR